MISGGFGRGNPNPHWHSVNTLHDGPLAPQQSFSTGVQWTSANRAIYVPVIVRAAVVVKQLWFENATTATGNYDIGLYSATGTALQRKGSTAKSGTAGEIVWDCTDTAIGPGIYYLALVSSTTGDTFQSASLSAPYPAALGLLQEANALPLPSTATFAIPQTLDFVPLIGMFLDTRVT
jgi:hypothetical protein